MKKTAEKTIQLLNLCSNLCEDQEILPYLEQKTTLRDILVLSTYSTDNFLNILKTTFNQVEWSALTDILKNANMEVNRIQSGIPLKETPNRLLTLLLNLESNHNLGIFPYVVEKVISKNIIKSLEEDYKDTINSLLHSPLTLNQTQRLFLENQINIGTKLYHFDSIKTTSSMKYFDSINEIDAEYVEDLIKNKDTYEDLVKELGNKSSVLPSVKRTVISSVVFDGGYQTDKEEATHELLYESKDGEYSLKFFVNTNLNYNIEEQGSLALEKNFPEYIGLVNLAKIKNLEELINQTTSLKNVDASSPWLYKNVEHLAEAKKEGVKTNKKRTSKLENKFLEDNKYEIELLKSRYRKEERDQAKTLNGSKGNKNSSFINNENLSIQNRLYAAIKDNNYDLIQTLMLEDPEKNLIDLSADSGKALKLALEQQNKTGFTASLNFLNKYIDNKNNPTTYSKFLVIHDKEMSKDDLVSLWEFKLTGSYKSKENIDLFKMFKKFAKDNNLTEDEKLIFSDNLPTHQGQVSVKYYVDNITPWLKPKVKQSNENTSKMKNK